MAVSFMIICSFPCLQPASQHGTSGGEGGASEVEGEAGEGEGGASEGEGGMKEKRNSSSTDYR